MDEYFEFKPDHAYRTEIPNIVMELGLHPFDLAIYIHIKRITGDGGRCWKSKKNMSDLTGVSETRYKEGLKNLSLPFEKLGGLSLIKITTRKRNDGADAPNLIECVDIWRPNGNHFRGVKIEGSPKNPRGSPPIGGEGSPNDHKEEPIKEEPLEEQQCAASAAVAPSAVVVPLSLENMDIPYSLKVKICNEYSVPEIDVAVNRALNWKSRPNDEAAIMTCLKRADTWTDNPTPEQKEQKNREFLDSIRHLDGKHYGPTSVNVSNKYVEFVAGMKVVVYTIDQDDFKQKVNEYFSYLKSLGYN